MMAIVDYGLGNIRAFLNIYRDLGVPTVVAVCSEELLKADKFILPGVGAFDHAMERLDGSGMRETLTELVISRRAPVLGVCVGMQILANSSEEGTRAGLGWIAGTVRRIRFAAEAPGVLPHMGWNTVRSVTNSGIFSHVAPEAEFYFLHSYHFECADRNNVSAEASYSTTITCAVNAGNVYGVQFHPEKSHHNGIQLLKNFADL